MKNILTIILVVMTLCSCTFTNPGFDEEVVLKKRPWFFGETGVDPEPVNSFTCLALTTTAVHFYVLPQKMKFSFDDLLSNDNTPLDVNMYMVIQVKKGHTPELLKNYGENWYETLIEPYFRNKVREYVSSCSPFDLMSNREVLSEFDNRMKVMMQKYIERLSKTRGYFPIEIQQVISLAHIKTS